MVQATTDAQGRFQMKGFTEGAFRIFATASDHLRAEYGSDAPGTFGKPLQLRPGVTLDHLAIKAARPSEIHGQLEWPDHGGPAAACAIEALRPSLFRGAVRNLPVMFAQSDADGRFHLIQLEPGDYLVRMKCRTPAKHASGVPAKSQAIDSQPEVVICYYPRSVRADSARAVHLAASERADLGAIEVRIPSDPVTVRAVLHGRESAVPNGLQATLYAPDDHIPAISAGYPCTVDASHTFTCRGIPPGDYELLASWLRPANQTVESVSHGFPITAKETPEPIPLKFAPGAAVRVKVTRQTLEGLLNPGEEPGPPIRVQLGGTHVVFESMLGVWKADAALLVGSQPGDIHLPPGKYRAAVQGLAAGEYLYAVRGTGVTDERAGLVEMEGTATGASIEFLIRADGGELNGKLTTESGEAVPGMQVALMPSNETYALSMARLTTTDVDGRFQFPSIPPGSYEVRTSTHIDPLSLQGPDSQTAGKLRIGSGEKLTKIFTMNR